MSDPSIPPLDVPPVILEHELMWRLELLSRDYERVRALREHLDRGGAPEQLIQFLVEQRILHPRIAEHLARDWAAPGDWFGDSAMRVVQSIREAFLHVRPGGPYLKGFWLLGFPLVRPIVAPTPEAVYLFVLCPSPPPGWPFGKDDPGLASVLRAARDRIEALLAGF